MVALECVKQGVAWSGFKLTVRMAFRSSLTGLRSSVGNVSGNRCETDCRSRGHEFDRGPVPYFRGKLQAKVCAQSTG